MKCMNKWISAFLAGVMMLSMLVSTPMTVTADATIASLDDNLVIHYDFEGSGNEAFRDKASGAASKISDNLTLKCAAREADFTVADGIVTSSSDCASVLYAGSSNDIKSISAFTDTASDATWFVRYMMNRTSLAESDGFVFDFNRINTYTMMYDLRKDGQVRWRGWATTGNASVEAGAGLWNGAGWVNASVTRSYDANTQQYTFTLRAYDDALNSKTVATQVVSKDEVVSYSDVTLALFGFFNEGSQSGYGFAKELSIDDFRLYNVALTEDQMKSLIQTTFLENEPSGDQTSDHTDHLVIHYDFEGAAGEAFQDKATGAASKVSDNLSLKCAAREADFTVANGIVTSSSDCASVLYAGSSSDIKSISTFTDTASDATWFVRYKMNSTSLTESDGFVFDFNHINNYTMMYDLRKDGQVRWRGWATTGNASVAAGAGLWNGAGWVNASVTRSYDAATQQYTFTLRAYDDALNSKTVATQVVNKDEVVSYSDVTLALFGFFNEGSQSGYGFAKELSIDDVRIYNTALSAADVEAMIRSEFIVTNIGAQKAVGTNVGNKVRLVAEIKGYDYKAAGFKVSATWDGKIESTEIDLGCSYAYTSLFAEDEGGNIEPIVPTREGYYLIAVIIDNIPTDKINLKLTFQPYVVTADGTESLVGEAFIYDVAANTCTK